MRASVGVCLRAGPPTARRPAAARRGRAVRACNGGARGPVLFHTHGEWKLAEDGPAGASVLERTLAHPLGLVLRPVGDEEREAIGNEIVEGCGAVVDEVLPVGSAKDGGIREGDILVACQAVVLGEGLELDAIPGHEGEGGPLPSLRLHEGTMFNAGEPSEPSGAWEVVGVDALDVKYETVIRAIDSHEIMSRRKAHRGEPIKLVFLRPGKPVVPK